MSDYLKSGVLERDINEEKVLRIYDGIDSNEFKYEKSSERVPSELGIKSEQPVVSIFETYGDGKGRKQ